MYWRIIINNNNNNNNGSFGYLLSLKEKILLVSLGQLPITAGPYKALIVKD